MRLLTSKILSPALSKSGFFPSRFVNNLVISGWTPRNCKPTVVLHSTKPVSPTCRAHSLTPRQRQAIDEETYESVALNLVVSFATCVVFVISSPSWTTAEFTLIRPVMPSMMPSALKSATVLFAVASWSCKVVMEPWRAWRPPPFCLLSSAGSSGMAEASDANVTKAREDGEPNMVNYLRMGYWVFLILLLLGRCWMFAENRKLIAMGP